MSSDTYSNAIAQNLSASTFGNGRAFPVDTEVAMNFELHQESEKEVIVKDRMFLVLAAVALLSSFSNMTHAQAGVVNSTQNPVQVGLLHWYGAIQSTQVNVWMSGDAPEPYGLTFDGSSLYTTDFKWGYLIKVKASDDSLLNQFGGGYLNEPIALAFDGANLWIANYGAASVTKLRASDGACNGVIEYPNLTACTFTVGTNPRFLTFDGSNIWVANQGSGTVSKLRASDGLLLGTFATGGMPSGVAFDGSNIWVANYLSNTLTKLRGSDGSLLGNITVNHPHGLAFDGVNVWVTNDVTNGAVTRLRVSDGACVVNSIVEPNLSLCTYSVGSNPIGVVYDGANIWATNYASNTVTRLRASDGACVINGAVQSGPAPCSFGVGTNPAGIAFDGANIWVANTGGNAVSKL